MNQPKSMGELRVYLLRHGDSRPDDVRRFIGQCDHPLNDIGRGQATFWRRELALIPFSHIYCSGLARAVETARIIRRRLRVPLTILPTLNEINLGRWDGMPISEVRRLHPQQYARRGADLAGYRPPGGESFADLSDRVLPVFQKLVQHHDGNLMIVGHAGVNRVILCHLLGIPLANLFHLNQVYGCLNILKYSQQHGVIDLLNLPADM